VRVPPLVLRPIVTPHELDLSSLNQQVPGGLIPYVHREKRHVPTHLHSGGLYHKRLANLSRLQIAESTEFLLINLN
jgi:hypothetical protein